MRSQLSWPDLLDLLVVRRLGQIVRRRFGAELGFANAEGARVAGPSGSDACARAATEATRAQPGTVRVACHANERIELATPILVGKTFLGCVYGSAPVASRLGPVPGADVGLLSELLELCASEIQEFQTDALRLERRSDGRRSSTRGQSQSGTTEARYTYEGIVGQSRPVQELCLLLDKVIDSDSTVLIHGENGTGKELVARAIHYNSRRRNERFVVQNCSAFNDNLLDSELFGHKRGAFTGAVADKQGLFETADRGTFFLDEIGDMSPMLQVKLLRVLQEGTFTPVGDTVTRRVDVRIIAATHRDLRAMVARGEFREDLYYRVNVIALTCPPLRDRRDDIPLLVEHFLRRNAKGRRARQKKLSKACLDRLLSYAWPGNIRELENEMERVVVLAGDAPLVTDDLLSARIRQAAATGHESTPAESLGATIDALERRTIYDALKKHDWNKTRAAKELRISRRNLIRKVEKYKLDQRHR